jgi:hypothetical protein
MTSAPSAAPVGITSNAAAVAGRVEVSAFNIITTSQGRQGETGEESSVVALIVDFHCAVSGPAPHV